MSLSMAAISRRQRSIHAASLLRSFATTSKRSAVPVQHRALARVLLEAPHDAVRVFRIDLHQPRTASAALAGDERGARASEQIRDDVSGLAAVEQCALDQLNRLRSRMNPVRRRLLLFPQRRLRLVAIPGVLLAGDVTVEQRLVPEFVAAEAPRKRILCPDDLTPDRKPAASSAF